MRVLTSKSALRTQLSLYRHDHCEVALVPTMGNLHAGHVRLVDAAQVMADVTVVSVFVNPAQFGPHEDYRSYPRTPERDLQWLEALGVEVVFLPEVEEIYPRGIEAMAWIDVPSLSGKLCGASRPGHFRGVATVVAKLLHLVGPDVALFGEKDYQQLRIIQRMVETLDFDVRIESVPTVREPDGLAMSSRNAYLYPEERATAPRLYRTLTEARDAILSGQRHYRALEAAQKVRLQAEGFVPEYFSVCRRDDLEPACEGDRELVIATAAWLGNARLIDNVLLDV